MDQIRDALASLGTHAIELLRGHGWSAYLSTIPDQHFGLIGVFFLAGLFALTMAGFAVSRLLEFRWAFLKSLPLGLVLPMIFFFGSVGPDNFSRNYANWAKTWGLAEWADWLGRYATGPRVFGAAALGSILYLIIAFVLPFLIKRTRANVSAVLVPTMVAVMIVMVAYGQYALSFPSQRHMTLEDFNKLIARLKAADPQLPSFEVQAVGGAADSAGYAEEFMYAFHNSGITINGIAPDSEEVLFPSPANVSSPEMKGLYIGVKDAKSPPDSAKQLQLILRDAGFSAKFANWAHMPANLFILAVSY